MKTVIIAFIAAFLFSLFFGLIFIRALKKRKAEQPIYEYVTAHKGKEGTLTFGGFIIFIPIFILLVLFGLVKSENIRLTLTISIAFMSVGFIDDYLKIASDKNEGLKAYQKFILLSAVSVVYAFIAYKKGMTEFYVPFTKLKIDLKFWSVILVAFVFVSVTNCVNLTDGLDGLAASVSVAYVIGIAVLAGLQNGFDGDFESAESLSFAATSAIAVGALTGFLCFNLNPAKIFMGDTGSLALGGLLGGMGVFSGNALYIPIFGITFVLSGISVIVQVVHYKRTKKRIFKMAPLHHHLELSGVSECKIAFYYFTATLFVSAAVILAQI